MLNTPPINEIIIGYQYFGGITTWLNPVGSWPAYSPVKLSQSKPYWTLAADCVCKLNGTWGGAQGGNPPIYDNMPQHHPGDSLVPSGGNQAFVDGSVEWIQCERMYYLTTWSTTDRIWFFYQDSKDFSPSLLNVLPNLRLTVYR